MALGKRINDNFELNILKIKSRDDTGKACDPYFQLTKKVDDKWEVQPNRETYVSGKLTKVQSRVSEFNGEKIPRTDVYLRDGKEVYLLELKYTLLSRNILNSLLNLTDASKTVEISLFTNKKGYAAASVSASDGEGKEALRWKYSLDEMPEPNVVIFKGKEQRDFTPVDTFFEQKVAEWSNNLLGSVGSQTEDTTKEDGAGVPSGVEGTADEDEPLF